MKNIKGNKGCECNRTICTNKNAMWFNHSTKKYYCEQCATRINLANEADSMRLFGHELCTEEKSTLKSEIETRSWEEFKETGLFLFINTILHAFGWCIVFQVIDGKIINVFPARTSFRGFNSEDQSISYTKIAKYLADNAANFPEEIKW